MIAIDTLERFCQEVARSSGKFYPSKIAEEVEFKIELPYHAFVELEKEIHSMFSQKGIIDKRIPTVAESAATFFKSKVITLVFPYRLKLIISHGETFSMKMTHENAKIIPMFSSPDLQQA